MNRIVFIMIVIIAFLPINAFAEDYVIGGGDTLRVSVWGSPELSLETTVRPDGKISIPALGEIKAAGYTPHQLTEILEKEMTKLVKTPIVTVIVTNMTNYRIFVFGRGVTAGVRTLARETSLLEFLSQLGSMQNADLKSAYLIRDEKKIKTDFYELYEKGDYTQDIMLKPNDKIFIPDNFAKRISVVGAVNNPTTINYRDGLTIVDVILSAGGFTEFAKKNDVKIIRKDDKGKDTEISVKAKDLMNGEIKENVMMKPGDYVTVKESIF